MKRGLLLGAVLVVALGLRLGFAGHFYGRANKAEILYTDNYTTLAAALVERGEFSDRPGVPTLDRPPGFPLLIALLYLLVGVKPAAVLALNCVLSAATGALAYALGRRLFNPRVGWLTLLFWTVYPYSIYYCGWTMRESFITLLVAAQLWCFVAWRERRDLRWAAACGALGGAIALTNPVAFIFLGLVPLALPLSRRLGEAARHAAVYGAVLAAVYAPWPLRNYVALGSPVLTNVHGGKQLYQAMLVAPEHFGTELETRTLQADPDYMRGIELIDQSRFVEANAWFKAAARRRLLRRPGEYLRAVGRRALKLWRLVPYERSYSHSYRLVFWASLLSDGLVIPLGVVGALALRRRWRELFPLYAAVAGWTVAYALVFVVLRFRMPVMLVPILLSAAWLEPRLPRRLFPRAI